jgi:hypothetical protein
MKFSGKEFETEDTILKLKMLILYDFIESINEFQHKFSVLDFNFIPYRTSFTFMCIKYKDCLYTNSHKGIDGTINDSDKIKNIAELYLHPSMVSIIKQDRAALYLLTSKIILLAQYNEFDIIME